MFFCDFIVGSFLKSKGKTNLTPNSPCVLHYKHMSLLLSKTYTNSVKNNIVFPWAPKFFFVCETTYEPRAPELRSVFVGKTMDKSRAPELRSVFVGKTTYKPHAPELRSVFVGKTTYEPHAPELRSVFCRQNYTQTTCVRTSGTFTNLISFFLIRKYFYWIML